MSLPGRYCCKSPKLPGANFPAVKKSDRGPPIDVASITLPGSPASFSSDNEVPHIFTWKSPVQPKEILIASAKRLLQQNLPEAAVSGCSSASRLFDEFVGAVLELHRHVQSERFRGLQVDHELEPNWGLDGKIPRFSTTQHTIHICCCQSKLIPLLVAIAQEAAELSEKTERIDGR